MLTFPEELAEITIEKNQFQHPLLNKHDIKETFHIRFDKHNEHLMGIVKQERATGFDILFTVLEHPLTGSRKFISWRHMENVFTIPQLPDNIFRKPPFNYDLAWLDCEDEENPVICDPVSKEFLGDPSIRIPRSESMSPGEIFMCCLNFGGENLLSLIVAAVNSYFEFRYNFAGSTQNYGSHW